MEGVHLRVLYLLRVTDSAGNAPLRWSTLVVGDDFGGQTWEES
jgi:hypothetical protein